MTDDDDLDPYIEDLRNQDRHERRMFWENLAHPDCRDPDHPGCEHCEEDEEEE